MLDNGFSSCYLHSINNITHYKLHKRTIISHLHANVSISVTGIEMVVWNGIKSIEYEVRGFYNNYTLLLLLNKLVYLNRKTRVQMLFHHTTCGFIPRAVYCSLINGKGTKNVVVTLSPNSRSKTFLMPVANTTQSERQRLNW